MRRSILAVGFLSLTLLSCHRGNKQLLGRWISVNRAQGGVANVVEFRSDGSLTSSWEAMLGLTYKLNGAQLFLMGQGSEMVPASDQSFNMDLQGDHLVLKSLLDGSERRLTLVKKGSGAPLAGKWRLDAGGGTTGFYDFAPDGNVLLSRVLKSRDGKYAVKGDSLSITFPGSNPVVGRFRLEQGVLVLAPPQGEPQRYRKAA